MTTEAVAVIPEPAAPPTLEVVPDPPAEVTIAEIAAGVTSALVEAWNAIRTRHPDVPEAVISMATGGRASAVELAHFAPRRWRLRDGDGLHHEVFVTAESLADGAEKVFGYLLHEATHAANEARGVDDCSASQYHNKHFRKTAEELGLVQRDVSEKWKKKYGFAGTALGEEAAKTYADQIAALDKAMHATRTPDIFATRTRGGSGSTGSTGGTSDAEAGTDAGEDGEVPTGKKEKEDRNYIKAVCQCESPTVIRVSPKTLERRPILCGDCGMKFARQESD
ncbi:MULTISPECIES: hypothetical protein [Streptomyces]|uniref:hypothetical protein n=1 Tax=Streptomyces TaxID=1883 RepID=UPI00073DD8DD|nr:hypothetical protein [Streptomyces sp. FBKL.4005]OYP10226.1 hypothetical protein CFC35_41250 [Streptomyces sp. FBKL.4005]CUW33384.1 hypothetical protein TUE45_pSRTUE45a_0016 [Streptomyces reticuli]